MRKNDVIICLIICFLLLGSMSDNTSDSVELNENLRQNASEDWDLPVNGSFDVQLLNLSLNNSGTWYDIESETLPFTNLSFQIQFNATDLDLEQTFRLELQLWSTHQNYSLIKHNDIQHYLFDTELLSGNNATHSSIHDIQMIDYSNPDQIKSRMHGCYWVEYSVKEIRGNPNSLPAGTSDRISFGETCPTDDSDFDGWSDSQENLFGSNSSDSTSNPYSVYLEQVSLYNSLLNQYNASQNEDTDGDSWPDVHEELFGSIINDPDSTPLTILGELNSALNAANNSLLSCQIGWGLANLSLSHCQSDFANLNSSYNDCIEGWSSTNSSLDSCREESNAGNGMTDCSNLPGCPNLDMDDDGWTDSVEFLCGSNSNDAESVPTILDGAICWELADDDLDGIRNMDDTCTSALDIQSMNSTGCETECEVCTQNGDDLSVETTSDDVEITGGGDIVDLIVIGGSSLLAGIGITSILKKPGKWNFKKPKLSDKNKEKLRDIVEDIDLELEFDSDKEIETQKIKTEKSSTNGSDQYFKSGVERQKAMTTAADPLLDDYVED